MPVPRDAVIAIYRYVLGREPENDAIIEGHARHFGSVEEFRLATLRSEEFANQVATLGINAFAKDKWVKTEIRNGLSMWVNLRDPYVSRACLHDEWEEPVVTFILNRLAEGDVFVDIGANIGWFTLLAAQRFRELGSGHVVAFEPRNDLFQITTRSVHENGLQPFVTLHQLALADRAGVLELAWNDDNAAASYLATQEVHHGGRHETVRVARMDDVQFPAAVRLIKSDAEGAEALLFLGARNLLIRYRPVIVCEFNIPRLPVVSGVTADEFLSQMQDIGYSCYLLSDIGELGKPIKIASDSNDPAANVVLLPEV